MRKDYLPVSAEEAAKAEPAFVEGYWTEQWRDRTLQESAIRQVPAADEARVIAPYLAHLSRGSKILDGGCGLGEWVMYYASQGFNVTGLDLSRETVDRLRQTYPDQEFIAGDIRSTGFPDNAFDAYFSWGTFEHFEEGLGGCLEEAARIVRPGGLLFISVPFQNMRHLIRDRGPLPTWDDNFRGSRGYSEAMRFYQWRLSKSELTRELELHGFRCAKVATIHADQGVSRMLRLDFKIRNPLAVRYLGAGLRRLLPGDVAAHMILAVGERR